MPMSSALTAPTMKSSIKCTRTLISPCSSIISCAIGNTPTTACDPTSRSPTSPHWNSSPVGNSTGERQSVTNLLDEYKILTAAKLDIMLPNRAEDVPTGARDTLETRPSEYRFVCEVNMLPVKRLPQSIRLRNLWEVPRTFCSTSSLLDHYACRQSRPAPGAGIRERMRMIRPLLSLAVAVILATSYGASPRAAIVGPGVGNISQGTQTDDSFRNSFAANHVTNVFATTQQVSCYTPEVPYTVSDGPVDWYSGETPCNGAATTGEDLGPYATQQGSNGGFPATAPVLVNNHSESDIQVDTTNPRHVIGSTKWFASAEGYNHVLGFYESLDGGKTWPVQGHIPGYEGWTDDTDPVGAFDGFGNYYELILPYQFDYKPDGGKQYSTGQEPNPSVSNEAISVAVRPHGATSARQWITTHNGQPDILFATNAGF